MTVELQKRVSKRISLKFQFQFLKSVVKIIEQMQELFDMKPIKHGVLPKMFQRYNVFNPEAMKILNLE